ncbi:hypothetical protein ACVDG8_012115 [Mesorhizobium sp. ORM8.1]
MLDGFDDDHRPIRLISRGRALVLAWHGNQSRPDRLRGAAPTASLCHATIKAFLQQARGNHSTEPTQARSKRQAGKNRAGGQHGTAQRRPVLDAPLFSMSAAVVSPSRWRANRQLDVRDIFNAFVPGVFSTGGRLAQSPRNGRPIQRRLRSNMTWLQWPRSLALQPH